MGNNAWRYEVETLFGPDLEWLLQMKWPEGETQGGPVELAIRAINPDSPPPGGLSQTLLREIDFKDGREKLRQQLANYEDWDRSRTDNQERVTALLVNLSGGAISDSYLALLSRVYVGAVNQGQDKPLEHLATVTGNSPAAIKNHLWQATRKGLLERSPGRAGGRVTGKAAALIESALAER